MSANDLLTKYIFLLHCRPNCAYLGHSFSLGIFAWRSMRLCTDSEVVHSEHRSVLQNSSYNHSGNPYVSILCFGRSNFRSLREQDFRRVDWITVCHIHYPKFFAQKVVQYILFCVEVIHIDDENGFLFPVIFLCMRIARSTDKHDLYMCLRAKYGCFKGMGAPFSPLQNIVGGKSFSLSRMAI